MKGKNQNEREYREYKRPSWAPPSWLFAPVWSFLYALILVSFSYAGYLYLARVIPFIVLLPFILNIIFNVTYTTFQFKLKNFVLASIDVLLILGTLIWAMITVYPFVHWVTVINIPYLLWVSFATILEFTVVTMNWNRK